MTGWFWAGLVTGLAANECCAISEWTARKLVRWSARVRYEDLERGEIRAQELEAVIADRPGQLLKLITAICFVLSACRAWLGRALEGVSMAEVSVRGSATLQVTAAMTTMFVGAAALSQIMLDRPPPTGTISPSLPGAGILNPLLSAPRLLVLAGNGTAYDLDSLAANWDPSAGTSWIDQNIAYAPDGDNGKPLVQLAGSPYTDVLMSGTGPWSYQDCASAPYGVNGSVPGPNVIAGAALDIGRGICVETLDGPRGEPKTDGNHYALLVVKALTPTTLTLKVTVWK